MNLQLFMYHTANYNCSECMFTSWLKSCLWRFTPQQVYVWPNPIKVHVLRVYIHYRGFYLCVTALKNSYVLRFTFLFLTPLSTSSKLSKAFWWLQSIHYDFFFMYTIVFNSLIDLITHGLKHIKKLP